MRTASAGLVLLLVAACGGQSISHGDAQGGDGGTGNIDRTVDDGEPSTGGTGVKSPGGGAPSASGGASSSSGGASPGSAGASSGGASPGVGARGPTGGLAGGAGGPSLSMLQDLCKRVCSEAAGAACYGIEAADCVTSCGAFVTVAEETAFCATLAYDFLACVVNLPDVCDLNDELVCNDGSRAMSDCVFDYCQQNPRSESCRNLSGTPE